MSNRKLDSLKIIPDSSFFVFFVDDINMPYILIRILKYREFVVILCSKVIEELQNSTKIHDIINDLADRFEYFEYGMYAEILRPLFSVEEIRKGEHEVIVAGYVYHHIRKEKYLLIIDEQGVRKFIRNNFPELCKNCTGTLGFTKKCYKEYKIISRDEILKILDVAGYSKFRINKDILDQIRNEVINES